MYYFVSLRWYCDVLILLYMYCTRMMWMIFYEYKKLKMSDFAHMHSISVMLILSTRSASYLDHVIEKVQQFCVQLWRGKGTMQRLMILVKMSRLFIAVVLIVRLGRWFHLCGKHHIARAWLF